MTARLDGGGRARVRRNPSAPPNAAASPRLEICFVLDTTGSMSGLIEGAKQTIWSIANEMVSARPTPELRFSLVAYRDRGDEYVTTPASPARPEPPRIQGPF